MWILTGDGKILEGKRLWLRPGTAHLLGRTSSKPQTGERVRFIDHKSVSRKHLILRIADVKPGDSAHVYSRSVVSATDSSKSGTWINGESLKADSITLDPSKTKFLIRLGAFPETFLLEWRPVTLTVMGATRQQKKGGTVLANEKEKLESADVKLVTEYLTNETTHVIAKKRNTAEGLQALVQAAWLVSESFVNALAGVCARREGDDSTSLLEGDFDKYWPNEMDYITPTGSEPVKRPNSYFKPDPERAEIFRDYSFIFLSDSQYRKLLPVVTGGGGKSLLCEFRVGETSAADVVDFAKEVAGKKGARSFMLSQEPGPGGIVVVRPGDKDEGRTSEILDYIQRSLDQRMIEQSELLDAILIKDASGFRRPLRDSTQFSEDDNLAARSSVPSVPLASSSIPRPPQVEPAIQIPDSPPLGNLRAQSPRPVRDAPQSQLQAEVPAAEQPSTRRRRRIITTQPRAKFGDDYDPSQIIRARSDSPEPSQAQLGNAPGMPAMDVTMGSGQYSSTQHQSRKRPASVVSNEAEEEEGETEEQRFDRLHPNQAALKRRRIEADENGDNSFSLAPTPEPDNSDLKVSPKEDSKVKKGKKPLTESQEQLTAKMKAHREEEEERQRREREADQQALHSGEAPKKTEQIIASMDVLSLSRPRQTESRADHPEWNGRPNFKGFRSNKNRYRNPANPRSRAQETQRVLITLEEVPGKGHGLGDDYWLENGDRHQRQKRAKTQSQSQSQSQARPHTQATASAAPRQAAPAAGEQGVYDDEDDALAFRRRLERSREEDAREAEGFATLTTSNLDDDRAPVRGTAGSSQTLRGDAASPQPRQTTTKAKTSGKRPAGAALGGVAPPAKKARQGTRTAAAAGSMRAPGTQTQAIDISDDDDPTAFRRKRR